MTDYPTQNNMIIGISGKKQSGKDTVAKIIQGLQLGENRFVGGIQGFLDSYSDYYSKDYPKYWQVKRFADKLKDIVCLLIDCTKEQLEDNEFKEKELGEEWWYYKGRYGSLTPYNKNSNRSDEDLVKLTPRLLMQLLGTECGRQIIHPNIWVNALMSEYKAHKVSNSIIDSGIWSTGHSDDIEYPNWIITDVRFPNEVKAIKDKGGIIIRIERPTHYYLCDNCGAEYIKEYEFIEGNTCPRCNYKSEGNLTLVIPSGDTHESETALDNYFDFDFVLYNNGTIEELIINVKEMLTILITLKTIQ